MYLLYYTTTSLITFNKRHLYHLFLLSLIHCYGCRLSHASLCTAQPLSVRPRGSLGTQYPDDRILVQTAASLNLRT